jgi:hypothetical protein
MRGPAVFRARLRADPRRAESARHSSNSTDDRRSGIPVAALGVHSTKTNVGDPGHPVMKTQASFGISPRQADGAGGVRI